MSAVIMLFYFHSDRISSSGVGRVSGSLTRGVCPAAGRVDTSDGDDLVQVDFLFSPDHFLLMSEIAVVKSHRARCSLNINNMKEHVMEITWRHNHRTKKNN